MINKNVNEKTSCGCKTTCDVPQNKTSKKTRILGLMAAMAICCIAPFGLAIFAGSATLMSLFVWFENPIIIAFITIGIGGSIWLFRRKRV